MSLEDMLTGGWLLLLIVSQGITAWPFCPPSVSLALRVERMSSVPRHHCLVSQDDVARICKTLGIDIAAQVDGSSYQTT